MQALLIIIKKVVATLGTAGAKIPTSRCTYSTKERICRFVGVAGIILQTEILSGVEVLASERRKFLIYTPVSLRHNERSRIVSRATSRVAKRLGLTIEVAETNRVLSPYVFYVKGDEEEVPVYCDWGKDWNEERIYSSIRSVVYALSFLLEYDNLQSVRG